MAAWTRLFALASAAAILACACGSATTPAPTEPPSAAPTASAVAVPSGSPDIAIYQTIEDQVSALRKLPIRQRLEPRLLSDAQVRTEMQQQFDADNTPDQIAVSQLTLQALGLLPAGSSLRQLYVDMLGSQVAGFYDPKAKTISVVTKGGSVGTLEKIVLSHEFDHALQDQAFDLTGIQADSIGQGDTSLAQTAVIEGDAMLAMTQWTIGNVSAADLVSLAVGDPQAEADLAKMPQILQQTLLFPYTQGASFITNAFSSGGWSSVDALYKRLPVSTEQILHADKYGSNEAPVDVAVDGAALAAAMGRGWSAAPADTLGEFQLRVWLSQRIPAGTRPDLPTAEDAAAGWGGDRGVLLRGPDGAWVLALVTAWDSSKDAEEFRFAATAAVQTLPAAAVVPARAPAGAPPRWAVLSASDTSTLAALKAAVAAQP